MGSRNPGLGQTHPTALSPRGTVGDIASPTAPHRESVPQFKLGCLPRKAAAVPQLLPARLSHHPSDQEAASLIGNHPNDGGVIIPPLPAVWKPFVGNPDHQYLGNDVVGDCVAACMGHIINHLSYLAGGPILVDRAQALAFYQTITRWNGKVGDPSDLGSYIQDAMTLLVEDGLAGFKINAFAELKLLYNYTGAAFGFVTIDNTDRAMLKQCAYDFGGVILGLQLPLSALTKFHAGQPWTLNKRDALDGGHCIVIVGWDETWAYCYTYGQCIKVAWDFIEFYVYESYVIATDRIFDAKIYEKYNRNQLNDEWFQITGHGTDPF